MFYQFSDSRRIYLRMKPKSPQAPKPNDRLEQKAPPENHQDDSLHEKEPKVSDPSPSTQPAPKVILFAQPRKFKASNAANFLCSSSRFGKRRKAHTSMRKRIRKNRQRITAKLGALFRYFSSRVHFLFINVSASALARFAMIRIASRSFIYCM